MFIYTSIYIYTYTYSYPHTHTRIHIHTYTYTYIYTYIYIYHVCVSVYLRVRALGVLRVSLLLHALSRIFSPVLTPALALLAHYRGGAGLANALCCVVHVCVCVCVCVVMIAHIGSPALMSGLAGVLMRMHHSIHA